MHLQDAWQWLDSQRLHLHDTLVRWCRQNSWSYNAAGLAAMAELLEADFAPLGLAAARLPLLPPPPLGSYPSDDFSDADVADGGPGLIWHHQPDAPFQILMLIHYDTVYSPSDQQPTVPIAAADSVPPGGRLYGPGTADAKGGIAVIRFAAEALLKFGIGNERLGWSIALNPDEEIGSPTSAAWLRELAERHRFGLVFEPTLPDGTMVANRKGTGNWRFQVGGRAAHAGRNPTEGRNAVVHAARLAIALDELNDPKSGLSVNVGRIRGGGPLNQVPDRAEVELNTRMVDREQAEALTAKLQELAERFAGVEGYACTLAGGIHSPPKRIDSRYAELHGNFARACELIGRPVSWADTGGACDGSKLAAAGLINIDTMGPIGGNLHSENEYCDFDSLITVAKTLVNLVAVTAENMAASEESPS